MHQGSIMKTKKHSNLFEISKIYLTKFFSAESVLSILVKRITKQKYLFALGVIILIVVAMSVVYSFGSNILQPYYWAVIVILVIVVFALAQSGRNENSRHKSEQIHTPNSNENIAKKGSQSVVYITSSEIPSNCITIERQLEAAQLTLQELEIQEAAIPLTERTATFSRNLREQREKVSLLEIKLKDCIEKNKI